MIEQETKRTRVAMRVIAYCFFVVLCSFYTNASAQQLGVFDYEASYSVFLDDLELGTSHRKVTFADNVYTSVHNVEPSGLAVLFGEKSYRQTSKFSIHQATVYMLESRLQGKDSDPSAVFDWDSKTIQFGNGKSVAIESKQYLDFEGWLASLQVVAANQINEDPFYIVQSNKLREYQYVSVKPTVHNIEGVDLDAWLIEMQRTDKKNEGFRIWMISEYRSVPVRIDRFKKGDTLTFSIRSLKWHN